MLNDALFQQLNQLYKAGSKGVWAGDLADKTATRELVRLFYANNSGGPPSSLDVVTISERGKKRYFAELERRLP